MRGQAEECCFTTCLILPSWSPGGSCSASFFSHGWLIAQLPSPFSALVQSPCSASALSPLPTLLCVLLLKNNRYIRAQRRRGCLVGSLSEPSSHFSMLFHPSASEHPICHLFPTLCLPHPVCPSQHFCPCAACPSSAPLISNFCCPPLHWIHILSRQIISCPLKSRLQGKNACHGDDLLFKNSLNDAVTPPILFFFLPPLSTTAYYNTFIVIFAHCTASVVLLCAL